jgi:hypothetical protein
MPRPLAEFKEWLKSADTGNADNVVWVCELRHTTEHPTLHHPITTNYVRLASRTYTDEFGRRYHADFLRGGLPEFGQFLSGDFYEKYESSVGEGRLNNADDRLSHLLNLYADGHDQLWYLGDRRWPFADFWHIFTCMTALMDAPRKGEIVVRTKDAELLLNQTIGGQIKVGGTGPDADRQANWNFGIVRQVEMHVVDAFALRYRHSDTALGLSLGLQPLIIKDKGIAQPVIDHYDGTVTLINPPIGTHTADLEMTPAGGGRNRFSDAMEHVVRDRGGFGAAGRWGGAHPSFVIGGDEDWRVGFSVREPINMRDLLSRLALSGIAGYCVDSKNRVRYGRLRPNDVNMLALGPTFRIRGSDIAQGSFSRRRLVPRYSRVQSIVNRNWSQPQDLSPLLTAEEQGRLRRPGLAVRQGTGATTSYADRPELYHRSLAESDPIDTWVSEYDDTEGRLTGEAWNNAFRGTWLPWISEDTFRVPLSAALTSAGAWPEIFDVGVVEWGEMNYDAEGTLVQLVGRRIHPETRELSLTVIVRHAQQPYEGRVTVPDDEPYVEDDDERAAALLDNPPTIPETPPGLSTPWSVRFDYNEYVDKTALAPGRESVSPTGSYIEFGPVADQYFNSATPVPFPNQGCSFNITPADNYVTGPVHGGAPIQMPFNVLGIANLEVNTVQDPLIQQTNYLHIPKFTGPYDLTPMGVQLVPLLNGSTLLRPMLFFQCDENAQACVFGGLSCARIGVNPMTELIENDGDLTEAHVSTFSEKASDSPYQPNFALSGIIWTKTSNLSWVVTQTAGPPVTLPQMVFAGPHPDASFHFNWNFVRPDPDESYAGTVFTLQVQLEGVDFGPPVTFSCEV